jgi:hypothetical protein
MLILKSMLDGGILVGAWAICVFFFRFWRKTHDPLFAYFAAAFLLLGIERIAIVGLSSETQAFAYIIRLFSFGLIILAIVLKNRRGGNR